jgi:uncharacterized protein (TIGR02996 family)
MERVGRYELEPEPHRASRWGRSHRAIDLETGAQVELTHIDGLDREAAKRLDALGTVRAPNVMRIVAVVSDWIASERLEGATLAEQLAAGLAIAVQPVLDGVAAGLVAMHRNGLVHRQLSPEAIVMVGGVPVLVDMGLDLDDAAPATDVHAFGVLAYRLLAGTDATRPVPRFERVEPAARAFVEACFARDASQRPALTAVPRLGASTAAVFVAGEAREAALLAVVRADPKDVAAREVYADWLEGRGDVDRATFVRTGATQPGEPLWRAVVATPRVERCLSFELECPKRWDGLAPTDRDAVRHCGDCQQQVFFVTSIDEARARGARRECIAIDAAVSRGEALAVYDRAAHPEERVMMMGKIAYVEPPEAVVPTKPTVLDRVRRWLRR